MIKHDKFQVAAKGLHFDSKGKMLLIKDSKGEWDFPGGRIGHNETLVQALEREINEELGVSCKIFDPKPVAAWTGRNTDGAWRIDVCFKVELDETKFKITDENVEHGYFNLEEARKLNLSSHLNELKEIYD